MTFSNVNLKIPFVSCLNDRIDEWFLSVQLKWKIVKYISLIHSSCHVLSFKDSVSRRHCYCFLSSILLKSIWWRSTKAIKIEYQILFSPFASLFCFIHSFSVGFPISLSVTLILTMYILKHANKITCGYVRFVVSVSHVRVKQCVSFFRSFIHSFVIQPTAKSSDDIKQHRFHAFRLHFLRFSFCWTFNQRIQHLSHSKFQFSLWTSTRST